MRSLLARLAASLAPAPDDARIVAAAPLAVIVPAMVGLALLGALLSFGDEYAATWVGEKFTLALRDRLLSHLQRLEPDALDRRRHGDVIARLTSDVHAIETLLLSALGELIQAGARLLFFTAALVQSANAQEHELGRFRRENEGAIAAELAGTRISGLFSPVIDLIELAGVILIIVLGTWALAAGDLTLGGLLAFLAYLAQLYRPIRDVSRLGQTLFEAAAGAERVIELLDTPPAVTERPGAVALNRVRGQLELDRVTYT